MNDDDIVILTFPDGRDLTTNWAEAKGVLSHAEATAEEIEEIECHLDDSGKATWDDLGKTTITKVDTRALERLGWRRET